MLAVSGVFPGLGDLFQHGFLHGVHWYLSFLQKCTKGSFWVELPGESFLGVHSLCVYSILW